MTSQTPAEILALEAGLRRPSWRAGVRASLRRLERSRWPATLVPETWLAGDARLHAGLDAAIDLGPVVTLGGGAHVETGAAAPWPPSASSSAGRVSSAACATSICRPLGARQGTTQSVSTPIHRRWLRCSSVTAREDAPSSRLAIGAPRRRSPIDLLLRGPSSPGGPPVGWSIRRGLALALGVELASGPDVTGGLLHAWL